MIRHKEEEKMRLKKTAAGVALAERVTVLEEAADAEGIAIVLKSAADLRTVTAV